MGSTAQTIGGVVLAPVALGSTLFAKSGAQDALSAIAGGGKPDTQMQDLEKKQQDQFNQLLKQFSDQYQKQTVAQVDQAANAAARSSALGNGPQYGKGAPGFGGTILTSPMGIPGLSYGAPKTLLGA